jgi:hypothetical protein
MPKHGLIDFFSNFLFKSQQPKAKRNLVAHLGAGFVFDYIHQAGKAISLGGVVFYPPTLVLSVGLPRQICALRVGEGVLQDIERQGLACEERTESGMKRGC